MHLIASFKYPFNDPGLFRKSITGFVILLIPFVGQIIWIGYTLRIIHEVSHGREEALPPWSDMGDYFVKGLTPFLGYWVYSIPFAALGGLIVAVNDPVSFVGGLLIAVIGVILLCLYGTGFVRYGVTERISAFFDVPRNAKILATSFLTIISTYIVLILLLPVTYFLLFASAILVITIFLGFFCVVYYLFVFGHALGVLARRIDMVEIESHIEAGLRTVPSSLIASNPNPQSETSSSSVTATGASPPAQTSTIGYAESTLLQHLDRAMVYKISPSRDTKWSPDNAKHFIDHLMQTFGSYVALQIVSEKALVSWRVFDLAPRTEWPEPGVVIRAIRAIYPEAEVTASAYEPLELTSDYARIVFPLYLAAEPFAPIQFITDIKGHDPLIPLVQAMSELGEGERFTYTIFVNGVLESKERLKYQEQIRQSEALNFALNAVGAVLSGGKSTWNPIKGTGRTGKGKYEPKAQGEFERKLYEQWLYYAYVLLQIDFPTPSQFERVSPIIDTLTILQNQFRTEYNVFTGGEAEFKEEDHFFNLNSPERERLTGTAAQLGRFVDRTDPRWHTYQSVFATEELATLWHLPHEKFTSTEIDWVSRARPANDLIANTEGAIIGDSMVGGQAYPIRIHPNDRETHMNIVGKTGVGKSTFMHNLIHQDIAAGKGVAVIDPHGKLVRDILRVSIPYERIDDVVVLDLREFDHPLPLNPLSTQREDDTYTANEIIAILEKLESKGIPLRVADTLMAAFVTLRKEETPTVRDVVKLFDDATYRYRFINQVGDVVSREFWDRFEGQSPSMQNELSYPVTHRMRKFYGNPVLHPIMCHPQPLDFEQLMRERKIILLSLGVDTRKVPEEKQTLLGLVVVSLIQMAAMSSVENPIPFNLYIDEVQNFVTVPLDKVFEEARKYKLQLVVANQFLGQLRGKVLESIMGTVGATAVFQIGLNDARTLRQYFSPEFEKGELENLDKYHAAVKTRYEGNTTPAFLIATRPEPGDLESPEAIEREQMIRECSIEKYTPMTRGEVMGWLDKRYPAKRYTAPNTDGEDDQDVDWAVKANGNE